MEGGEKTNKQTKNCLCGVVWLTRRSRVRGGGGGGGGCVLGRPIARATSYYLLPDIL